jgi:3-hydroxy-9,10-secoandrosta-1,3,5(10)-triene-9,17-dione monooxygenase
VRAAETFDKRDVLDVARALAPQLRKRAARADADRRLPAETLRELVASGLFGILKPRIFGGAEIGVGALVEVTTELSAACGSTGWVYGVLAGHGWLLNLFPVEAQREVFADPDALTATVFRLNATVTRGADGYRLVGGEGRFCSGIDYAAWVMVGAGVAEGDGPPERRFFLVPRDDLEIVDDWFTTGMRGTGSRSIRIPDAFVPAHRSVPLQALLTGNTPGGRFHAAPIYRMPFQVVTPFSLIGAPLGVARGAVETFTADLAPRVAKLDELEAASRSATFARIAHAAAEIDAARALVLADAARVDGATDTTAPGALDTARIARNWAYAAQTSRGAVTRLFEAAGGSAVYDGSAIQRAWRDVNSAAQHFAFVWDNAMVDFGRALFDLAPSSTGPGAAAGRKPT